MKTASVIIAISLFVGVARGLAADEPAPGLVKLPDVMLVVAMKLDGKVVKSIGNSERDKIQKECELKLRQSGIGLDPKDESKVPAVLLVSVDCIKSKTDLYVYSVQVSVLDSVTIERNGKSAFPAVWDRNTFGYAGSDKTDAIKDTVSEMMTDFCNEWLKANPKK